MVGTLLARGMLVGLVAGVLALIIAEILGEPQIDRAIAVEEEMSRTEAARSAGGHERAATAAAPTGEAVGGHHHDGAAPSGAPEEEEELVSRGVQGTIGLATGVLTYGAAFGGLFALAFAFANGRVGTLGPRATAALVAGAAFVAVFLVPALKYPPNPPAVGDPDTIAYRTQLFFFMMLVSLLAMAFAISLGRGLVARLGAWNGVLAAAGIFLLLVAVAQVLLPTIDEVPAAFPASTLWRFRLASLGIQAVMWTTIGLLFGALTERAGAAGRAGVLGGAVAR